MGVLPMAAFAQLNTFTTTTLSSAVTASGAGIPATVIYVASATGISGPTLTNPPNQGTLLYADREAMRVQSVNGTAITVQRGADGTRASGHLSGVLVWIGNPDWYFSDPEGFPPSDTCTLATTYALPKIEVLTGEIYTCDSLKEWSYAGPFFTDGKSNDARTTVSDAAYTALAWDHIIAYTALTAARIVTLPAASSMPGKVYIIQNESTGDFTITAGTNCVVPAVSGGLQVIKCRSNGTAWFPF
jgi:hypothetical protein